MFSSVPAIKTIEDRSIALRLRPDLSFDRQTQQGQVWWVVKDPLSLKYFRLREEQYDALCMLDAKTSLKTIRETIERKYPLVATSAVELQSLFLVFHRSGLVLSEGPGQNESLLKRRTDWTRKQFLSKSLNLLWIKLPGIDPDRFLTWLLPHVRWMFSPITLILNLLMMLGALLLVLIQFEHFQAKLPAYEEFFVAGNFLWLMAGLAISKILHELGHALACKYFGGECHQIGLMLLVFTPCLYCDTSDSWMLKNKWKRAAVGAAGMYVELTLAAICTFLWWNTHPGLLHYLCLSIMTVCSISTLVFNSNPLLRYDGYYILSDLIEVPNLSSKAQAAVRGLLEQWLFGSSQKLQQSLPNQYRWLFAFYAVASPIYRWLVVILILWVVSEIFEPYGLKSVGYLLISVSLIGMLVTPIWQLFRYLRQPGRLQKLKVVRFVLTVLILVGMTSLILLYPIPHYVIAPVVTQAHASERVYVNVPGTLRTVNRHPGDVVQAGDVIAQLENREIEFEISRLIGRRSRLETELTNLRRRQSDDQAAAKSIPQVIESIASLTERLKQLESERSRLSVNAPCDGVILSPDEVPKPTENRYELMTYHGTPFDARNRSAWLETGTVLCQIGNPDEISALLIIDQADIDRVAPGQQVEINFDEYPAETWVGQIDQLSIDHVEVAPREAATKFGGALATETDQQGREIPAVASYEGRVVLHDADMGLLPGFRGRAKISVGRQTVARTLWQNILKVVRLG